MIFIAALSRGTPGWLGINFDVDILPHKRFP